MTLNAKINKMSIRIGIIGLGRVGIPVSRALLKAGFNVYGYDIREEAVKEFESLGGHYQGSPESVGGNSELVLILVLNDKQVIETISGEKGVLQGMNPGGTIVCMSTINRKNLVLMADKSHRKKIDFVDCPFTGGPARIPDANLTLIAAAPDELLEKVSPVLNVIGNIVKAGDKPGLGQAVKHCNQLLVGVTHAAVMEVITLARKLDLDPGLVCNVVGMGIAGSEYFRLLSESVLQNKPSPGGLGQMCKDVSIVVNTAYGVNFPAYLATAAGKYFSSAEQLGLQDQEGAALIDIVEQIITKNN
jgi:3-hydroxyisobutyrate dehydrogenase-like beta-hydroxyacid dehydrogenase